MNKKSSQTTRCFGLLGGGGGNNKFSINWIQMVEPVLSA